jgi:putative aldouronate transport system permease protein
MAMVAKKNAADFIMYVFLTLFALFCLLPMVLAIVVSFSVEESISRYGYSFMPSGWTTEAYRMIFAKGSSVMNGFGVSVLVTVTGTLVAVLVTAMAAYALANKSVEYRNMIALYFFVAMSFSAGLVPWYLMCRFLGLTNNFFALIIPSLLFSPFNMFLVRNFMDGLPDSLRESATLDGANDVTICIRIYLPLSLPVLATVTLFYGLGYWNDWWNAIMLVEDKKLYPLQYLLLQLRSQIQMIRDMQTITGGLSNSTKAPSESVKMATSIVTIGPIVILYPFLQRYFVKGLVIGAVKG